MIIDQLVLGVDVREKNPMLVPKVRPTPGQCAVTTVQVVARGRSISADRAFLRASQTLSAYKWHIYCFQVTLVGAVEVHDAREGDPE